MSGSTIERGQPYSLPHDRLALPVEASAVVMVVDDNADLRRSTARVLAAAGFAVSEAASGEEAITTARAELPDAVVLDVGLPDLSGFEVCRILKGLSPDLPILYLSGTAVDVHNRVRALRPGADGYLIKPAAPAELVATLDSLLQKGESRRRIPEPTFSSRSPCGPPSSPS